MWDDLLKTYGKLVVYRGDSIEEITDETKIEQIKELLLRALAEKSG